MDIFDVMEIKEYFILVIYIFVCGFLCLLINTIINDFTFYHILIPYQINLLIGNIGEFCDFAISLIILYIIL